MRRGDPGQFLRHRRPVIEPPGAERSTLGGKGFLRRIRGLLVVAGTVAIIPGAPLGVITLAVQALCGLMLPSTTIIVLMLANDAELMGPWKNSRWF